MNTIEVIEYQDGTDDVLRRKQSSGRQLQKHEVLAPEDWWK